MVTNIINIFLEICLKNICLSDVSAIVKSLHNALQYYKMGVKKIPVASFTFKFAIAIFFLDFSPHCENLVGLVSILSYALHVFITSLIRT